MSTMPTFNIILTVVGSVLLLLGFASGVALFLRALRVPDKFGDEANVGTLWGLFILGVSAGLFLIWWGID